MTDAQEYYRKLADEREAELIARAADKPAHAAFLAALLAAGTWDKANEVETPKRVSERAADALFVDVGWILQVREIGENSTRYERRYHNFRAASGRGAAARQRYEKTRGPQALSDLFAGIFKGR